MKRIVVVFIAALMLGACNPYLNRAFVSVENDSSYSVKVTVADNYVGDIPSMGTVADVEIGIVDKYREIPIKVEITGYAPVTKYRYVDYGEHIQVKIADSSAVAPVAIF